MAFAKARALGVDFLIHYGMRPQKLKGGRATSLNEQWPIQGWYGGCIGQIMDIHGRFTVSLWIYLRVLKHPNKDRKVFQRDGHAPIFQDLQYGTNGLVFSV